MGLNIIYTICITLLAFSAVVYFEIKGINHKICNWVLGIFKVAIPLKEAVKICSNSDLINRNTEYFEITKNRIFAGKPELVSQEMFLLLELAEQKKITLYGHRHFSTNRVPLQHIPVEYLLSDKNIWSDDYTTLYYYNSKDIAYTDIVVKERELKKLLNT